MLREYESLKIYNEKNIHKIPQISFLSDSDINMIYVISQVFPFKVNEYVLNELINWENPFDDAIFRLTFPHYDMLSQNDFECVEQSLRSGNKAQLELEVSKIRARLNPHPSGQMELNVPRLNGLAQTGLQHKYKQTLLVFPAKGQTCHSYCTFCFRWPQFTNDKALRFSMAEKESYLNYLRIHPEITDVLFTGGDPMIMNTGNLRSYIEPLLSDEFENIKNIRIGTKSLSYWPQRYVNQGDSLELLKFFEKITLSNKHLAIMANYNHFRELEPDVAKTAIRFINNTGAVIRSQGPVIKHINDDASVWSKMWTEQLKLGVVPYYMFVERDTGAHDYFKVPLHQTLEIYREAFNSVSGLARTVRGPVMSETNGKVEILDTIELDNKKYFILRYIQARDTNKVGKIYFAEFSKNVYWHNELKICNFDYFEKNNMDLVKNYSEVM